MRDYTMGGFWAACIAESVAFFFVRNDLSGLERVLVMMVTGLVAYFVYLAYKKAQDGDATWNGQEIFSGFFAAGVALWAPVLLSLIFGWGLNY